MQRQLRLGALLALVSVSGPTLAETLQGTLFKNPECTCCEGHADYLRENGINLQIRTVANLDKLTTDWGLPEEFHGCHTIVLSGYKIAGHVTWELIKKLVTERPADVVGISLQGMPVGVPGMPGKKTGDYTVYAVHKDGSATVWGTQ